EQALVVLQDVDLAAARPLAADAERPESRPEPRPRVDPPLHLETAILPAPQPLGGQAGGGVAGILPVGLPIGAVRLVARVLFALPACLDDQPAPMTPGVLRLVPLQLLIADEAGLITPVPQVWA